MKSIPLISLVLISSLFGCSNQLNADTKNEDRTIKNSDYIISDYYRNCDHGSIDSNLVLTPTRCELIVENANTNEFYNQIIKTSNSKWIELIQSDTLEISKSAVVWLYYLNQEKIDLFELALLENRSDDNFKKYQLKFWNNYFNEK